jgi:hypothetical protein
MKFPVDAPRIRVVKAAANMGFQIVREREHITMRRTNADGTFRSCGNANISRCAERTLMALSDRAGTRTYRDAQNEG